ncbi:MAG: type IX secretion system protein PorQ [Saprospiraceae bacterium]
MASATPPGRRKTNSIWCWMIACSLVLPIGLTAQVDSRTVYEFTRFPVSPFQTALGGAPIALSTEDVAQSAINPATMDSLAAGNLSTDIHFHFAGIKQLYAGYGQRWKSSPYYWALGMQYMTYGTFDGADEFGNLTTPFQAGDFALQGTVARAIRPNWRLGASLKWIYSSLEGYSSTGAVLDIGLHRRSDDGLTQIGLVSRNVGLQFTAYSPGNFEPVPFDLQFGISRKLAHVPFRISAVVHHLHRWNLLFEDPNSDQDVDLFGEPIPGPSPFSLFVDNVFRHVIFGGEFLLGKQENLQIRLGYNHQRRQELSVERFRSLAGFSGGIGFKVRKIQFDYGFSSYHLAGSTHHLGIRLAIREWIKPKI